MSALRKVGRGAASEGQQAHDRRLTTRASAAEVVGGGAEARGGGAFFAVRPRRCRVGRLAAVFSRPCVEICFCAQHHELCVAALGRA